MAAVHNRLDDPWREQPEPYHAPHVAAADPFALSDLSDRVDPAREQVVRPPIATGCDTNTLANLCSLGATTDCA